MKEDLPELQVKSVGVAVVPELDPSGVTGKETMWQAWIINLNEFPLNGVIITAKGYGELNGEKRETSTLRYLIEELPPKSYARIEPVINEVLGLSNEYWVSYFHESQLYDKRFVFLPETITATNLTRIPLIERQGVLIL